ncbi:MAG: N-acetyltransferase [Candidatus Lokiarchaeota archaeon]|nr:N-acetyltransferase [Candidatus Lokiarchaeota archaeon]
MSNLGSKLQLNEFILREFVENDLKTVMEINLKCLPENYPDFFFLGIHYKFPKSFLVVEDIKIKEIVGYCMFRGEKGVSNFGLKWTKKAHLVSIAVLPKYRRKNIGISLLKEGLKQQLEHYESKEAMLEVRISNSEAIEMYKKLGFIVKKNLTGYYKDGETAYLMSKLLD